MKRTLVALMLFMAPLTAGAAERIALVVGMASYRSIDPLANTVRDAVAISRVLEEIGFQVTTLTDVGGAGFRQGLEDFAFRAETSELALIYYAGHGVEVQGENFLIPVDADVRSNLDIQRQSLSLSSLLSAVDGARRMRIVILDSCRNNPFGDAIAPGAAPEASAQPSGGADGLAPAAPERGTLVAYAARDGQVALDGEGTNSPFARALINNLPKEGLEISLLFRQVRDEVLAATANQQEPQTYGSLSGTPFYLAGPGAGGENVINHPDLKIAWSDIRPDQESRLAALAGQGDTRSLVGLAYMRLNSLDSRYDPVQAADFLTKAAAAGSAEAQFELGRLYETGIGVATDPARALAPYHEAAAQEFPDALNDLGFLYFQGEYGVIRDPARALDLFERAARRRHPQAMFNYAALIDDGLVPGRGPEEAADLLYRALRSGNLAVFEQLRDRPTVFTLESRKALQRRLAESQLYSGPIDGAFGPGTQRSIRVAYGMED